MRLEIGDWQIVEVQPGVGIVVDRENKVIGIPRGYVETLWLCDELDLEFNKKIFGDDIEVLTRFGELYLIRGKRSFSDGPVGIAIRVEMDE